MSKPISDYVVAAGAAPMLAPGFLLIWLFWFGRPSNSFTLENGKRVKNGSWRWWWYRLMLGYQPTERCPDCRKITDSRYITDICQCAFELDMRGMK